MKNLAELLGSDILDRYGEVFDSIMPGGERWNAAGNCLGSCPYYDKCRNSGPSRLLCSEDWRNAPASPDAIKVLHHVFQNFDYYDQGDYKGMMTGRAAEIFAIFDINHLDIETAADAQRLVSVRLKHAKFKANLFSLWEGCSIDNVSIPDEYLIASHIKPWAKCNHDQDKINAYNGFLLPANYDFLFDRFLITFGDDGDIQLIDTDDMNQLYDSLGIDRSAWIPVKPHNIPFLKFHQSQFEVKAESFGRGMREPILRE